MAGRGSSAFFRAVPLGGLGRIGGNMMLYETAEDAFAVDCGVNFPTAAEPGVYWVIPDISYALQRRDKFRGYVLTHGHEDHIGALPYILPELPGPIWGTEFTLDLVRRKFKEHDIKAELYTLRDNASFLVGNTALTPVPVTHSIPGSVALAIETPVGMVVHTGDFKIDNAPLDGRMFDVTTLGGLGDRGVTALFSDSTNSEKDGHTWTEREVGGVLAGVIEDAEYRVVVTTFSSNVYRVQSVLEAAQRVGRKVIPTGRSMCQIIDLCLERGYVKVADGLVVTPDRYESLDRSEVLVLASGCQAEEFSAFGRIAAKRHSQVALSPGDRVIVSSRRIPGNERVIGAAIDNLVRQGIDVVDDRSGLKIHTSGHAFRREQEQMLALCRPQHFIPVHGELRHMQRHAQMARIMGAQSHVLEDGFPITLVAEDGRVEARRGEKVAAGNRYVDGDAMVAEIVLRDRRSLSDNGFVTCTTAIDGRGRPMSRPSVLTRGVVWVDENPDLIAGAEDEVLGVLRALGDDSDHDSRAETVRIALRRYFKRELGRRPVIVPSFVEVDG